MKPAPGPALLLLLSLFGCASEGRRDHAGPTVPAGPTIRVLLKSASSRPEVRLASRAPYTATVLSTGRTFAEGPRLDRKQAALGSSLEAAILVRSADGILFVDGVAYPGELLLDPADTGVNLVLRTNIERYLPGVLAGELSAAFPPSALRAQAIASRSYALHRIRTAPPGRSWDVTDDTGSQVFVGLPGASASAFAEAVAGTRGMVLTWGADPLPAYFHSTCGGHTAALSEAFKETEIPPLVGTRCDFCRASRYYRWSAAIPLEEVGSRLSLGGPVTAVVMGRLSRSGRAEDLSFRGPRTRRLPAADARALLGPDRLYSTRIAGIEVRGGALVLHGSGWGHGVGLCQMGSWGMASGGASAADILGHYYPGAALVRMY